MNSFAFSKSSVRLVISSFLKIAEVCFLIVLSVTKRVSAMSLRFLFSRIKPRTSFSRCESVSSVFQLLKIFSICFLLNDFIVSVALVFSSVSG